MRFKKSGALPILLVCKPPRGSMLLRQGRIVEDNGSNAKEI
jgi:hypothetical protein